MKIYKEILDAELIITIVILIIVSASMLIGVFIVCKVAQKKSEKEEKLKSFCEQECTENNEIDYECSNQCYEWYTTGRN
jgi:NADH:ubiquinone oxidoreductase subunit 3 (subunit A)